MTDVLVGFFEALTNYLVGQLGEDLNFEGLAVETFEDLQDHFLGSGHLVGLWHVFVMGDIAELRPGQFSFINEILDAGLKVCGLLGFGYHFSWKNN